jgi:hypothetical protein
MVVSRNGERSSFWGEGSAKSEVILMAKSSSCQC